MPRVDREERIAEKKKRRNQGIKFNKTLGQHILINPAIIDNCIRKARLKSTDVVLEIGPGTGNMTVKLLEKAKKVVVIELDKRMIVEITKRVKNTPEEKKLEIIHGDILKVKLPYFDVCIANIPYQVSSGIVFKLLNHSVKNHFRSCFLMFQREFALRLCAQPKSKLWCRLSSNSQLLAKCEHVQKISKNSFRPPPKVESSIVKLTPIYPPPPINYLEWDGLTRLLFSKRNKKLTAIFHCKSTLDLLLQNYVTYCALNNKQLDQNYQNDKKGKALIKKTIDDIINDEYFLEARPIKMDNDDFLKLLGEFNKKDIHFTGSNE